MIKSKTRLATIAYPLTLLIINWGSTCMFFYISTYSYFNQVFILCKFHVLKRPPGLTQFLLALAISEGFIW